MKNTPPEFLISEVLWEEDKVVPGRYAILIGRCGDRPIAKGEVLHCLYRYRRATSLEEYAKEPIRVEQLEVALRVLDIQSHNRSWEFMGEGMTGALFVQGDGFERLSAGWVLGEPEIPQGIAKEAVAPNPRRIGTPIR